MHWCLKRMTDRSAAPINASLKAADPAIAGLIDQEKMRQETHLELIASENFTSKAVMEAQGSVPVSYTHLRAHET
mgnify:CR=1 FL=1